MTFTREHENGIKLILRRFQHFVVRNNRTWLENVVRWYRQTVLYHYFVTVPLVLCFLSLTQSVGHFNLSTAICVVPFRPIMSDKSLPRIFENQNFWCTSMLLTKFTWERKKGWKSFSQLLWIKRCCSIGKLWSTLLMFSVTYGRYLIAYCLTKNTWYYNVMK